ncbi:MAG TPA: GNAT family N-acetyltransferase [Chthoniobacterales bacterium]
MRFIEWVRFTWDLEKLPTLTAALPEHYHIALAGRADEKELRALLARSFAHDASWGDAIHDVKAMLDEWLEQTFAPEPSNNLCLALRHGARMIGAAIVVPNPLAEDHLAPGPCVQMEYRNRGLGTALLAEALRQLQAAGLQRAVAITRRNGPVARFLYPKFNGTVLEGTSPLLAA